MGPTLHLVSAGLIETRCNPGHVCEDAIHDARTICMREKGSAPDVVIYGDPDFTFPYVPSHLHHMVRPSLAWSPACPEEWPSHTSGKQQQGRSKLFAGLSLPRQCTGDVASEGKVVLSDVASAPPLRGWLCMAVERCAADCLKALGCWVESLSLGIVGGIRAGV